MSLFELLPERPEKMRLALWVLSSLFFGCGSWYALPILRTFLLDPDYFLLSYGEFNMSAMTFKQPAILLLILHTFLNTV